MKKVFALLLALCMIFALVACGGAPAANNDEKVIKIGVFEPASGDSASGGKKETLGIQFANAECPTVEINGENVKYIFCISIS